MSRYRSQFSQKWGLGVVCALVVILWGFHSLASGSLESSSRRHTGFKLDGVPATFLSLTLIAFGCFLHFDNFWANHPKSPKAENLVALLSRISGMTAAVCLIVGLLLQFTGIVK